MTTPLYFREITAFPPGDESEIVFNKGGAQKKQLPPAYQAFLTDLELAANQVRSAFDLEFPEARARLINALTHTARVGLGGAHPNLSLGKSQFEVVKLKIANEAYQIRRDRIHRMIQWSPAWVVGIIALLSIWFLLNNIAPTIANEIKLTPKSVSDFGTSVGAYGMALFGVVFGSLLMAFGRNRNITFENFTQIKTYRLGVVKYLTFLSVLAAIIMILLYHKVVQFGLGTIVLNDFIEFPSYGVIIGLVCAVSEPFILGLVTENLTPDSTNKAIKTGASTGTPGASNNQSPDSSPSDDNHPSDKPPGNEPPEKTPPAGNSPEKKRSQDKPPENKGETPASQPE